MLLVIRLNYTKDILLETWMNQNPHRKSLASIRSTRTTGWVDFGLLRITQPDAGLYFTSLNKLLEHNMDVRSISNTLLNLLFSLNSSRD